MFVVCLYVCFVCCVFVEMCVSPPQSVADAHATLSLPKHTLSHPRPGRWGGHRHTNNPSLPPSSSNTAARTSSAHKPPRQETSADVSSSSSSSDEADSNSPFSDSSDSETETADTANVEKSSAASSSTSHSTLGRRRETDRDAKPTMSSSSSHDTHSEVKPEVKSEVGGAEVPEGWAGSEVTLFRMFHPLFGHNYCSLSEMIKTKSCRELYEYGRGVSTELLRQNGEGQQLVSKKKKRNMRSAAHIIHRPIFSSLGF